MNKDSKNKKLMEPISIPGLPFSDAAVKWLKQDVSGLKEDMFPSEQLKGRNSPAGLIFAEIFCIHSRNGLWTQNNFQKVYCANNFSLIQLIKTKNKFQPQPQGFHYSWLSFVKPTEERLGEPGYIFLKTIMFSSLSSLQPCNCNCHILEERFSTFSPALNFW